MITLTPAERDIHRAFLKPAQEGDPAKPGSACSTYKGLGMVIDPEGRNKGMTRRPFRTMFPALGHVSMYEVEHGRPMLSALVVNQETDTAGPGFADLARHLQFDAKAKSSLVTPTDIEDLRSLASGVEAMRKEQIDRIDAAKSRPGAPLPTPLPSPSI